MFTCSLAVDLFALEVILVNFCQNLMKIILKESYWTNIIYWQITDSRPSCGRKIIAKAADGAMT